EGIDKMSKELSVEEICAYQWKRCVEKADYELSQLNRSRVYNITYADLVGSPNAELKALLHFLNVDVSKINISLLANMFHSNSLHKWKKQLDGEQLEKIMPILEPTLSELKFI